MDRLVMDAETETKIERPKVKVVPVQETKIPVEISHEPQIQTEYLNSLENKTIGDVKKAEEEKVTQQFLEEKEELIEKQYEKVEISAQQESQKTIEKPNYDLIAEEKKVVKLKQKGQTKKKSSKKTNKKAVGIALACALAVGGVICVTNAVVIDNMSANYFQIDETYNLNLAKYLKNIANLDTTKTGMEFLETYPEEELNAGDVGEKTNWFDRLCNFIGGLFGG